MVIIYIVVFGLLVGGILAFLYEKEQWNNGISPYTNERWRFFDCDSQGGRGYIDSQNNTIWVSWPFID